MNEDSSIVATQGNMVLSTDIDDEMVPFLLETEKITNENCKLCNSEHREEAEEMYDNQRRKNYAQLKNAFNDKFDLEISDNAIRNHILYHYKAVKDNLSLKSYAEDVQKWVDRRTSKVHSLKSRIAILEREMFILAEEGQDLDMQERRKNADMVKKLAETIMACEDKLEEFREQVKPVNMVFNQLKVIMNDEVKVLSSVEFKQAFGRILTKLHSSLGDVLID